MIITRKFPDDISISVDGHECNNCLCSRSCRFLKQNHYNLNSVEDVTKHWFVCSLFDTPVSSLFRCDRCVELFGKGEEYDRQQKECEINRRVIESVAKDIFIEMMKDYRKIFDENIKNIKENMLSLKDKK